MKALYLRLIVDIFSCRKIKEFCNIKDEILHKNGINGSTAPTQQQQKQQNNKQNSIDESGEHIEVPSSTVNIDDTSVKEHGVATVEEQDHLNSPKEFENNVITSVVHDDMETIDYGQEELYDTVERTKEVEECSNNNNEMIGNQETEQEREQLETSQSSLLTSSSSSSSSYIPSPSIDRKSTRVSIHRELDTGYTQPVDVTNVRLYHMMM